MQQQTTTTQTKPLTFTTTERLRGLLETFRLRELYFIIKHGKSHKHIKY